MSNFVLNTKMLDEIQKHELSSYAGKGKKVVLTVNTNIKEKTVEFEVEDSKEGSIVLPDIDDAVDMYNLMLD